MGPLKPKRNLSGDFDAGNDAPVSSRLYIGRFSPMNESNTLETVTMVFQNDF